MQNFFSPLWQICLYAFGYLCATNSVVLAQVTSDGTVNTQVNQNGNVAEITGGETRGGNLFHSFQDFSVPTDNSAFFNNADSIANIFSRVTGGNISNIDGLIRANGSANLFLINPAGILFGQNARLDIGGSFYGSTASSILFEDGEFSAVDLENPPLLTVNAPIGLSFRDEPGEIVNQANFGLTEQTLEQDIGFEPATIDRITSITGLEVDPGQNLALIGGNITLERSGLTAPGGNVTLGGLSQAGTVAISPESNFSFPENAAKADLSLENNALVSVIGNGGGAIDIDVSNLTLSQQSQLRAGIAEGSGDSNTVAGDIVINASDSVTLIGSGDFEDGDRRIDLDTAILNTVGLSPARVENSNDTENTMGNGGSIAIDTKALNITERGTISTQLYGVGNAGKIDINANTVTLDEGTVVSQVGLQGNKGRGNSGDININSNNFTATNLSFIVTDNNGTGEGNAGDINLSATDSVVIQDNQFTALISEIGENAVGTTGNINIVANSLDLENSVQLLTQVRGIGNTGSIDLDINDSLVISGGAALQTQVLSTGEGTAGNIEIDTNTLELLDNSFVLADSRSLGNSGEIIIRAKESLFVSGSIIARVTIAEASGNSGEIEIISPQISLTNRAIISSSVEGLGDTGDINIDAETVSLDNFSLITASNRSEISLESGNININADRLTLTRGSIINATNSSTFDGGQINIKARTLELLSGSVLQTATDGNGNAGDIVLIIDNAIFLDGNDAPNRPSSFDFNEPILDNIAGRTGIFANAGDNSLNSGGNIFIDSGLIVAVPNSNSDIIANALRGRGGNITINATVIGFEEGSLDPLANNINASSGVVGGTTFSIGQPNEVQANIVASEQTIVQACQANREIAAKNNFVIEGRGGITPEPGLPLNSSNIYVDGEANQKSAIPKPIETSQGKIQPARGIEVTQGGKIILTAYRTNNAGQRIFQGKQKQYCN